ncbi:hypothetical protein A11A3_02622 [Alcanivorax hongdengensis A-11-3]|uniref:Uncharacterized protein n=1 Tax=Alcanivorax hongdengensis A-11-3 TaxID=1177179 RepID=L0WHT8_9GAMM|nr:hypothetical protein [Alcanivorax hongdengensis]EKF75727.1 hypothetical protein A11A3_02622 [Alcanivorax hongdengensis A-11-3]
MDLDKVSLRNAWQAVADTTEQVRNGSLAPGLGQWLEQAGFRLDDTVFSGVCQFDEDVFSGTLVDGNGHAWEFVADLQDSDGCCLEDVTDALGPKSPDHPGADLCDRVTMALYYQRQQMAAA